ncbi:hypothetical protein [Kribbella sp. HUAS MG21]|uniref:hypothetical protein n=1 Tax=Kribbella sp. HUAS MG21 TaxID=3160966 RepID=UPI0033065E7E
MTDAVQAGTEWVPSVGMLEEVSPEHAAVIRGLFELAAFVADHPEFRAPAVHARFYLPHQERSTTRAATYVAERGLVNQLAAVLGVEPDDQASGHYTVTRSMGAVIATSTAISPERWAQYDAEDSYRGCVQPAAQASAVADDASPSIGGAR